MYGKFQAHLQETIADLKAKSLYKIGRAHV